MAPISVTLEQQDPTVAVVTLIGEHDAFSAPRVENELAVLLDAGVPILVDLRDCSFLDSQTLSTLLAARHQAEEAELGFTVALDPDEHTHVHRLLDMTGLRSAFAIHGTLEQAKAAAAAGQASGAPHVRAS